MDCDISVIVPAHNEGRLAHHTMNSLFRSINHAKEYGIRTEIIIVLDRADDKTITYFDYYKDSIRHIHRVDCGDPGLARNYGVTISSGKYVAFLDADDLFGKNWLKAAYEEAQKTDGYGVFHPEYVICFERENFIVRYKGMYDEGFRLGNLIEYNCWNSVHILTQRELLLNIPYVPTPSDSGFGYEDWHWNCEVIARGIIIRVVPDTCVFYRKKMQGSRQDIHNLERVIIPPSRLFEPAIFSALLEEEKRIKMSGHK